MKTRLNHYLQMPLIVLDLFILNCLYLGTLWFYEGTIPTHFSNPYIIFWLVLNICWLLICYIVGTYAEKTIIGFETFTKRTVQVYILWVMALLLYLIFSRENEFSRFFILLSIANFALGLSFNRFLYFGIKNYFKRHNHLVNNVIILGFNDTAKKLASYFEEEEFNTQLLGFVEDAHNVKELTHYPILSNIDDTIAVAEKMEVQEIYSTITPEQNKFIYNLMHDAEKRCIRFKVVPNLSIFLTKPVVIDYIRDLPVLSRRSDPLEDVGNRFKKRLLDLVVSSLVIVFILSWLIPLLGLLIKLESKGTIFFNQLRTGKNDRNFYCLKFRSMRKNKESDLKQATLHDSRVTKLGAFMRKTSLDEFPQFINVFKGEMSLVGPRPHMVKHTTDFSKIVDQYMIRQLLKPGITGWAQINSFRGEITNPEQIRMRVASDLWYLENWTIWLDVRIIFLTVYQVFAGDKHAY